MPVRWQRDTVGSGIADLSNRDQNEGPHLWATALFDEVTALGYAGSYPSFTRGLRARDLRPACEPCHPANAPLRPPPNEARSRRRVGQPERSL